MNKSLLIVLAAAAFPTVATAAPAADAEIVSVGVDYADLALNKQAGADTLGRRVQAAIASVCARPANMRSLKEMRDWQDCRDAARSQVQDQITPVLAYGKVTVVADRY